MARQQVVVIGSGFGGLSAAIRLAAQGHSVTVLEKRDKPGGRAYVYEQNGFTFDGGPTIITAPFMLDDLFALAGERREDHVELVRCDPFYRIFDHQGRHFDYNGDEQFTTSQIIQWNAADADGYRRFLASTRAIFEKGFVELADKPFLRLSDMLAVAPDLVRLGSYRSVYSYVSRFIQDPFLRQCFSFHPLLVGGNPFDASSIYAMIHYLEREWGVHYVMGGTGALVREMVALLGRLGGSVRLENEVEAILTSGRRVKGVRLASGEILAADVVVSN
ncbi:MAG TPA: phytoene desaturase family protein, partial [Deinococcales bacterium]|nr:phytoene desaturase family protein [Deinococcales bacterium]